MAFLLMGLFTFLSSSSILSPYLISSLNFIPMVCVILAYTGYGLGYSVIPNLVAAEIMPVEIRYDCEISNNGLNERIFILRSTVVGILMTAEMSSTFVLSKLKPILIELLGIHGLFTMFAGNFKLKFYFLICFLIFYFFRYSPTCCDFNCDCNSKK